MSIAAHLTSPAFKQNAKEALADPQSADVQVLRKSLVIDLKQLKDVPEKIEGIALIQRQRSHLPVVHKDSKVAGCVLHQRRDCGNFHRRGGPP